MVIVIGEFNTLCHEFTMISRASASPFSPFPWPPKLWINIGSGSRGKSIAADSKILSWGGTGSSQIWRESLLPASEFSSAISAKASSNSGDIRAWWVNLESMASSCSEGDLGERPALSDNSGVCNMHINCKGRRLWDYELLEWAQPQQIWQTGTSWKTGVGRHWGLKFYGEHAKLLKGTTTEICAYKTMMEMLYRRAQNSFIPRRPQMV